MRCEIKILLCCIISMVYSCNVDDVLLFRTRLSNSIVTAHCCEFFQERSKNVRLTFYISAITANQVPLIQQCSQGLMYIAWPYVHAIQFVHFFLMRAVQSWTIHLEVIERYRSEEWETVRNGNDVMEVL